MKINQTQRIGAYQAAYSQAGEQRTDGAAGKKRKDEVQISAEAKELLDAQGKAGGTRAERIESLKKEVSTGTYYVDTDKLTEKLLPFVNRI